MRFVRLIVKKSLANDNSRAALRLKSLRKILEDMFGLPLSMPDAAEEAAAGAAYLAARFVQ